MANGTYLFGGVDGFDAGFNIDAPIYNDLVITKTGDTGPNNDALVLDAGDTFEVSNISGITWTYLGTDGSGGIIAEFVVGPGQVETLWLSDTQINVGDPLPAVVSGDTTICFAAGTLIATPEGDACVEDLEIGKLVMTADGRTVPVRWLGQQTVQRIFSGDRARPVRVAAGALGDGLPHTDLVLTADHALILDGLAINAGALVNGTTITLDPAPDCATYYHIETEEHDVILANGAPAETFIDYVGRQAFDNHAEYVALYGDERIITEMPLPRISSARLLPPALKARLAGDAAA